MKKTLRIKKTLAHLARMQKKMAAVVVLGVFVAGGAASLSYFGIQMFTPVTYENDALLGEATGAVLHEEEEEATPPFIATHLPVPEPVRALYMTSWVAGAPKRRDALVRLIENTELNAVVIDIKDYSGHISFPANDPLLARYGAAENRIPHVRTLIADLHERGIYVIGRITVFQDPYLAMAEPRWAVKKESATSTIWTDYKGLAYIDPGATEAWEYTIALARESYEIGFDELNFDYIRFPSDGNMRDIYYPHSEERVINDPDDGKAKIIRSFFKHLYQTLKDPTLYTSNEHTGKSNVPVLSADLFGMVTTNTDDLNIGQVLEYAEPYFDYIAPMVYPSHYPKTFIGLQNPGAHPYAVVNYSLNRGAERMREASSSPKKLRPWLQDFDLGADYDAEMVRSQMRAAYDAGVDGWMLWSPSNVYTRDALLPADAASEGGGDN